MSYILEALKKSEQQRNHGRVPDLQTVHLARPEEPDKRIWPYVVIVVLLVSLAFALGWMQPWKNGSDVDAMVTKSPAPVPASVETEFETGTVSPPEPAPEARSAISEALPTADPVQQPEPAPARDVAESVREPDRQPPSLDIGSVPHLSEMPRLVQQAIPEMSFAGHVYSSNAEQRSVIINGRSMEEGDTLISDLVVEQITRKGIIFNYQGQLFRMEILQDWSLDY